MNQILNFIVDVWTTCACFNAVVFLIYFDEYKDLVQSYIRKDSPNNAHIPPNQFILWIFVASVSLGPIATISVILNVMDHGSVVSNLDADEDL